MLEHSAPSAATLPDAISQLRNALADRYRIERELGQGGVATVYLAHDLRHDRQVALSRRGRTLMTLQPVRGSAQAVFVTFNWFDHLGAR